MVRAVGETVKGDTPVEEMVTVSVRLTETSFPAAPLPVAI
jgi:hypothetical protein